MRILLAATLGVVLLQAADNQRVALALRAQVEFSRVETSTTLRMVEPQACVQAQAALLPVATREEVAGVHYQKGFCMLAGASLTRNAAEFSEAAAELQRAIDFWPNRTAGDKNRSWQPLPSGLRVLASIARLKAGIDDSVAAHAQDEISAAEFAHECAPGILQESSCQAILGAGRQWLGWLALRRDDVFAATREFAGTEVSGWTAWANGRKEFRYGRYAEAATQYRQATETWETARRNMAPPWIERLGPPADLQAAYRELGGAQLLAGNPQAAIVSLNLAVKDERPDARAIYLRARAKELTGQLQAAQADYSLASRTAFATGDAQSGEAHLYRGILFYRRNDFAHAEDEFSSALNFEIIASLRAEAAAWRQLAAVASGSCGASRDNLERSLAQVSPYFPKDEARTRIGSCAPTSSARSGL